MEENLKRKGSMSVLYKSKWLPHLGTRKIEESLFFIYVCLKHSMWLMKHDIAMNLQVLYIALLLGSPQNGEKEEPFFNIHAFWIGLSGSGVACLCCSVVTPFS